MSKVTLNSIGSRYGSLDALNDNFDQLEAAIDNALSRDGTGPNSMEAPLDMGGYPILNASEVNTNSLVLNGQVVEPTADLTTASTVVLFESTATSGQTSFSIAPYTPVIQAVEMKVNGVEVHNSLLSIAGSTLSFPALVAGERFLIRVFTREIRGPGLNTSDNIAYTPSGAGAVNSTVQAALRRTLFASDYSTLAAALAEASQSGRPSTIHILSDITLSSTLVVNASNISFVGAGADIAHDVGSANAQARVKLIWAGAVGGTMVEFASVAGASAQKLNGGGVSNIAFVANGAARCVSVKSWNGLVLERLYFHNPTAWGVDVDVITGSLGEGKDSQYNVIRQCFSRHIEAGTGGLLRFGGDSSANASFNRAEDCACQFLNGNAYQFDNSDNNILIGCAYFRAGGGTGNGYIFNGSNDSAGRVARSNVILHPRGNGGVPSIARGTSSFTFPSIDNVMLEIDADNAMSVPTFESGAKGRWSKTDGMFGGWAGGVNSVGGAFGNDSTSLNRAVANLGSATLFVDNGSEAHMVLGDGTNRWSITLQNSTGDLRLSRITGSGAVNVGNGAPVRIGNKLVTEGAVDSGGTGFRVLRVPN